MNSPTPHLEASLQSDIDAIRTRLLTMMAMDERALERAFRAFLKRDQRLAYSVILRDQEVDGLETEADRLCLEFIVRHQPAASHLRFVYSANKIVNELERVGDYAESIARQALLISSLSFEVPTEKFAELANLAIPMLHNAVHSFVDRNPDLARTTMAIEPRVNQVRDSLTADLLEWRQEDRLPLEALTPLITIARRFERVSDQAKNICEQALYFATGESVRHSPRQGWRICFLDDANNCLSLIAEAIACRLGEPGFAFASSGVTAGAPDPQTVQFLAGKGIDISRHTPTALAQTLQGGQVQVLVALTRDAEVALPQGPKSILGLRWMVPDPSRVRGLPEEIREEHERAFDFVTNHIRDLVQAILGNLEEPAHEER
jgi:phosphate transport system protein